MKAAIISILNRFPRMKRIIKDFRNRFINDSSVSAHYVTLHADEANSEGLRLRNSWQDNALPVRQRELVENQLQQYRSGKHIDVFDVFDVFVSSLQLLPDLTSGMSLLEIGCSSGFYSEVLEIAGLQVIYSGCDYSDAFIQLAREKYPTINFSVEDATLLSYPDNQFDIVVSGCCLLHIPDYMVAVIETARVACRYVIFHRTPVIWGKPEQWYRKQAYGVETVEIHFNEPDFLALLDRCGLDLITTHTLHEERQYSDSTGHAVRTYVCMKKVQ